jgi:hypothetical protein
MLKYIKRGLVGLVLCLLTVTVQSQTFLISAGNNAVSMPAVKFNPMHPSFQVGMEKVWTEKKFSLVQNFRAGYLYQRLAHHAIPVYTELGYRYTFKFGLSLAAYLDAGYVHTFSAMPVYKLNDNGEYKRTARAGKAHAMFGYSVIAAYKLKGKKIQFTPFIQHQFWMMTPFVKSYVPLLPNSTLHIGTYFTINR